MQKLTPCLWFNFNADVAVEHYLSIFKNGKVLAGFAGSVAARLALSPRLALELAGGFDIFRTRMVFAVNEDVFLTTPWLSPWLGAGLAWETVL